MTLMEMVTTWALRENRRTGLAPLVRREEKWREEGRGESRREVKKQVLPYLEDVEEERFYVDEIRRQMQVEEIGRELAAGKELDNMEAMDAEVSEHQLHIS